MDAYDQLRKAAREKRDQAILEARLECQRTLHTIKALRARITDKPLIENGVAVDEPKRRKIIDVICEVMPQGYAFTMVELQDWVQQSESGRAVDRETLRTLLHTLKNEGVVRRVARAGHNAVTWEYVKPRSRELAFEAMLLPDAAAVVLGDTGPLRIMELVVALQSRGYRRDAKARTLLAAAGAALRRNRERFSCDEDRRWGLA
ncbi:MAG: hypothetical protein H0T51_18550 [Pirellulales bacterium]|nr:hypothetical protein [Pirellulales bacterium]